MYTVCGRDRADTRALDNGYIIDLDGLDSALLSISLSARGHGDSGSSRQTLVRTGTIIIEGSYTGDV